MMVRPDPGDGNKKGEKFGFARADQINVHHLDTFVPVGENETGNRGTGGDWIPEIHHPEAVSYTHLTLPTTLNSWWCGGGGGGG